MILLFDRAPVVFTLTVNQPPLVSIIIAAPPEMEEVQALAAARDLDWPADRKEIILARGRQPSAQRNAALRAARGSWVYFLDDDALPGAGILRHAEKWFSKPEVALIGGPNLCPESAPWLEKVFSVVLGSWLAFGPSRARYRQTGKPRYSSEKELILCNTLARRDVLLAFGGFNEALYPNEENALMDDLQKAGYLLVYDPGFFVHRRPRKSVGAFLKMLRTYGRGRAEQFRLHPTPGSILNFVPPLFCLYGVLLAGLVLSGPRHVSPFIMNMAAIPLTVYLMAVLAQTLSNMAANGVCRACAAAPLLPACHCLYGIGFWIGLLTPLNSMKNPKAPSVSLEIKNQA